MKRQFGIVIMAAVGLLILAAGCGKNETSSGPGQEPAGSAPAQESRPAATQAQTKPPVDAAASVEAGKTSVPVGAKPTETAPATAPVPVAAQPPAPVVPTNTFAGPLGPTNAQSSPLSAMQLAGGLQEALSKGLQQAVARLGREGGFLTNPLVKIPMPEKLHNVESGFRAVKQDKLADDFVATMNHAAELAVPDAAAVFADALRQMTISDATAILSGPNDAATQYFQRTTQTNLYARFYPIVQQATAKAGVTAAYKKLMTQSNLDAVTRRLGSLGGTINSALVDKDAMDLDGYVTSKALEGLYKTIAEEETRIRQDPKARTSELMQKVFGGLKK